jgi:hypothetical protein
MSKIKILYNTQDNIIFNHWYLRPELNKYFDIINYNPEVKYSASEYLVMIPFNFRQSRWFDHLIQEGAKLVYDVFWEHHVSGQLEQQHPTAHIASCKSYFWVNEYYINCASGYNSYIPNKNYTHRALLPIRQSKPHRKTLLTALTPWLNDIIYSTVDQGRFLPDDQDESKGSFYRYFNPNWYNSTYFNIVAESITGSPHHRLLVTEKTFKPIAYYHPFIVFGQVGVLEYLHELGFETFENLFDESYDCEEDQSTRLAQIVANIANFKQQDYDTLTWKKLNHNHDLFYNQARVEKIFVEGIVNPILEYAETR